MITTYALSKNFGNVRAVSGLDWQVPPGSIYGLLGPNGAGKSTTLRMLLGMVIPTGGEGRVAGFDIRRESASIRKLAAYVPDRKTVHPEMRLRDFLRFYGSFYEDWSSEDAVRRLDAWGIPLRQRLGRLSKGEMTKVLLAAVFARKAQILFLDEPTEGLDPSSVADVLAFLAGWTASREGAVVFCSHRLDEIERICDRVGFMQGGRLLLSGELDDLRASCKSIDVDGPLPIEAIRNWTEVQSATVIGDTVRVVTQKEPRAVIERLAAFHPRNVVVHDLNLRDIYLNLNSVSTGALS
jgi:ABC-2 type transport system ATP-binding protein